MSTSATASSDPSRRAQQRNLPLFLVYAVTGALAFSRGVFLLYLTSRGVTDGQSGVLQASLFVANFLFEVPTGVLGDRFGRRWSVLIGVGLQISTTLGMLWGPGTFWSFLVLFVLNGIAFSFISGSGQALLFDTLKSLEREGDYLLVNSRLQSAQMATLALAIVVGGYLAQVSWGLVYGANALALSVSWLALWLIREDRSVYRGAADEPDQEPMVPIREAVMALARSGPGRRLILFSVGCALVEATTTPYFIYTQRLFTGYSFHPWQIGWIYASAQIVSAGAMAWLGRFAPAAADVPRALVAGSVAVAAFTALNGLGSPWVSLGLVFVVVTIPDLIYLLTDRHIQENIDSRARATLLSMHSLINAVGVSVGYLVWGRLFELLPMPAAYAWSGVMALAAAALFSLSFRRPPHA